MRQQTEESILNPVHLPAQRQHPSETGVLKILKSAYNLNLRWHNNQKYQSEIATTHQSATEVLSSYPSDIVYICTNDIHQGSLRYLSPTLGAYSTLKKSGSCICVSGLMPIYSRGYRHFSRLLLLHTWLSLACDDYYVSYIDHFNLFWERRQLFRDDGLYPNMLGAKVLFAHFSYNTAHPRVASAGSQNTVLFLGFLSFSLLLCLNMTGCLFLVILIFMYVVLPIPSTLF